MKGRAPAQRFQPVAVLMTSELRQLRLSLLRFSTLIIIEMRIDLSDHEAIRKASVPELTGRM